jgi:hypothetical protein
MELHSAGADNKESQQKNKFYSRRKIFILNQSGACQQPSGPVGRCRMGKRRRRGIPRVQLFFRFSPALYDELERKYKYASQRRATSFARSLYHYERAALERDAQEHTDALYFYDKRKQHFKRQPRKRRQSYVLENARHFASTVISTFPLIAACHLSLTPPICRGCLFSFY